MKTIKRLPTEKEFFELLGNCQWEWTKINEVNGYKVTGKNGNFIFLPATGFFHSLKMKMDEVGYNGYYWSSLAISDNFARNLYFSSNYVGTYGDFLYYGQAVRLVSKDEDKNFIDLGLSVNWATCNVGATRPEEYGHYMTFNEAYKMFGELKKGYLVYSEYIKDRDLEFHGVYMNEKDAMEKQKAVMKKLDDDGYAVDINNDGTVYEDVRVWVEPVDVFNE